MVTDMYDFLERFRRDAKVKRAWVRKVAEATGMSKRTLRSYIDYPDREPRYSTIRRLEQFYAEQDK